MPILTTLRIFLAGVALPCLPAAHAVGGNRPSLSRTACASGTRSLAVEENGHSPFGARNAACSTARFSEMLIFPPRNMRHRSAPVSADSCASCTEELHRSIGDAVLFE